MAGLPKKLTAQLDAWRKDLINLSRNNRLIYCKTDAVLEIVTPAADDVYRRLEAGLRIAQPKQEELFPGRPIRAPRETEIQLAPLTRSTHEARLRSLERSATQAFMDRGLWTLYVGFGLLEWDERPVGTSGVERVLSPLLLVPVRLERESTREPYKLKWAEEDQRFNPALGAKLEEDHNVLLRLPEDDEGLDPQTVFREVGRQVASKRWRVLPRMVLSTFSFHKEPILKDLTANEETVLGNDAIQALALGSESGISREFDPLDEEELDALAPPEQMVNIRDADASQRRAIAAASSGHSFVMDGPPGTGKSQTIANMIADLLAKQRTVLFVSEKAAALEVVYDRLKESGLAEFVLELHSHKATRKEVAKELGRSLRISVRADEPMQDADRKRLKRKREELSAYATALHEVRLPLGQSLHRVLGSVVTSQNLPQAPIAKLRAADIDQDRWVRFTELGGALGRAWGPVTRGAAFLWRDLAPGSWDAARQVELEHLLEAAAGRLGLLSHLSEDVAADLRLPRPQTTSDVERLHAVETLIGSRGYVHPEWLSRPQDAAWIAELTDAQERDARAAEIEAALYRAPGPNWPALASDGPEGLLHAANELRRSCSEFALVFETDSDALLEGKAALHSADALLSRCQGVQDQVLAPFKLDSRNVSLRQLFSMVELATLATSDDRPEAAWFSPSVLAKVQTVVARLQLLQKEIRDWEKQLGQIFMRAVVEQDLETLVVRFETTYKGPFKWFNSEYRRDRALLRSATRTGKLRKSELARLRDALAWQKAIQEYAEIGRQSGAMLGPRFEGEATDFNAFERAIVIALEASALAGTGIGPDELAEVLGRQAPTYPTLQAAISVVAAVRSNWPQLKLDWAGLDGRTLDSGLARGRNIGTAISRLVELLRPIDALVGRSAQLGKAERWLSLRREHSEIEHHFDANFPGATESFGEAWAGRTTDWEALHAGIKWASRVRSALGSSLDERAAKRLVEVRECEPRLAAPLAAWLETIASIVANFVALRQQAERDVLRGAFADAMTRITALQASREDIGEWYTHVHVVELLTQEGLAAAVGFCRDKCVAAETVGPILERSIREAWADDVLKHDERLTTLRSEDRAALVEDFQKLDRKLISQAARETIARCNARRPKNMQGAAGIILAEAEKQKRHMPVRDLIRQATDVVQAVKPCFMMSPLSVSQFLPPDIRFDVVIFDEASQVRPADAIASIYRGSQLIVAGDKAQLPPTTFFERMESDDEEGYDGEDAKDFESILDLCKGSGAFTSLPLRWHYRSQHEHLIAYSNHMFYDGLLVTFPSPMLDAADLGVEAFLVEDGMYRRGAGRDNPNEAEFVAQRALLHAKEHPQHSLGVVAFSEAQASTIELKIERLADEHPELRRLRGNDRLRSMFVKNLETAQGDERDIIIFSMGYGPDEAGKLTMNFGPVSRAGGERRLNVAITRARRKVEFVTSVKSSQITSDGRATGTLHLRKYLEYAERQADRMKVLSIPLDPSMGDFESPFETEVARVVRSWGFDVVPQVGCSGYRIDLAVRDPESENRFVLGIECDGAMYHSTRVARDRDRLRQEVLERLNWRLYRIWGPSWYRKRAEQERELRKAIEAALNGRVGHRAAKPPAAAQEEPEVRIAPARDSRRPTWVTVYRCTTLSRPARRFEIHEPGAQPELVRIIHAIVRAEGPIHTGRALRLTRESFGLERAGNRVQEAFESALKLAMREDPQLRESGGFLSFRDTRVEVRVPRENDAAARRSIEEVPMAEIELAVQHCVIDALQISSDDLCAYIARLFGWERRGANIDAAISTAIRRLVRRQVVGDDGNYLRPGPTLGNE